MDEKYTENEALLIEIIKRKVKRLHSLLKLSMPDIKLGECYEIFSKVEGYKDWNTMIAALKKTKSHPLQAASMVEIAIRVFGSEDAAFSWLNTPNPALAERKPVEIWGTEVGGQKVADVLGRIVLGA